MVIQEILTRNAFQFLFRFSQKNGPAAGMHSTSDRMYDITLCGIRTEIVLPPHGPVGQQQCARVSRTATQRRGGQTQHLQTSSRKRQQQ